MNHSILKRTLHTNGHIMTRKNMPLWLFYFLSCVTPVRSQNEAVELPGVRNGHAMVYHEGENGLFVFGGADERRVCNETWLFGNGQWKKLSSSGPPARTFSCMVYRSGHNEVILFGGNKVLFGSADKRNVLMNDTWIWRDGSWTQVETDIAPEPRSEACMAYDASRDVVILFGGFRFSDDGKSLIRFGDTWEFDGNQWARISVDGPSPRSGCCMAFHADEDRVILFGGNFPRSEADKQSYNGALWSYREGEWEQPGVPTNNIYNAVAVYHPERKSIIRFGGWNGSARLHETWQLRDGKWSMKKLKRHPEARNHTIGVYDPTRRGVVIFGGHNGDEVFGDVWLLRGKRWARIFDQSRQRRIANGH